MKSNIFRKVINEEYIEVNKSVSKTIEHLCELNSSNKQNLPADTFLHFLCSKKGTITVRYTYRQSYIPHWYDRHKPFENIYPLYCVYGQVISKAGKTYVKMNSVYNKYNLFLQRFTKLLAFLLLPFIILMSVHFNGFNLYNIFVFLLCLALGVIIISESGSNTASQKSRGLTMLPYMEKEIKRRVQIIEKWDE